MTETLSLEARVKQDTITAMKARDGERTTTLRLITTALKNKAIEKRAELTPAEAEQVLASMIKQRRDSIEQFTKGGRAELAAKEAEEIALIEHYLPKALGEAELILIVQAAISEIETASGKKPTAKEMGLVIKATQTKLQSEGLRAEGRVVSETVKAELTK